MQHDEVIWQVRPGPEMCKFLYKWIIFRTWKLVLHNIRILNRTLCDVTRGTLLPEVLSTQDNSLLYEVYGSWVLDFISSNIPWLLLQLSAAVRNGLWETWCELKVQATHFHSKLAVEILCSCMAGQFWSLVSHSTSSLDFSQVPHWLTFTAMALVIYVCLSWWSEFEIVSKYLVSMILHPDEKRRWWSWTITLGQTSGFSNMQSSFVSIQSDNTRHSQGLGPQQAYLPPTEILHIVQFIVFYATVQDLWQLAVKAWVWSA